jgi:hypothetical protein
MVELVDTRDLKSRGPQGLCRFESGPRHHFKAWAYSIACEIPLK